MTDNHVLPEKMRAVVVYRPPSQRHIVKADQPVPHPAPDEILTRVYAVAINPSDWKLPDLLKCEGAVCGADWAGTVVAVGSNVKDFGIGDRVGCSAHAANPADPQAGGFAEYATAFARLTWKIPDEVSFTDAAAIGGCVIGTVGLAMFHPEYLGLDFALDQFSGEPMEDRPFVLVYGGSTASGTMAIQLLRLCGFRVVATCSPSNAATVESYGAEKTFDYNSSTCAKDIKAATGNALEYALDTVVDARSVTICDGAIGRAGGRYAGLELLPDEILSGQAGRKSITWTWVMGTSLIGREYALEGPYRSDPRPEIMEWGTKWFRVHVQELMDKGLLRTHPVRLMDGGLDAVPAGVEMLFRKQVRCQKLVYNIMH